MCVCMGVIQLSKLLFTNFFFMTGSGISYDVSLLVRKEIVRNPIIKLENLNSKDLQWIMKF